MTHDNDRNDRTLGLSTAQVIGSALAAMSGAFSASFLGTTGTLIGAAVGSVIATVGAAIYTHSLQRTGQVVKRTAVVVKQGALLTGAVPRPDPGMVASEAPVRDPNAPDPGDASTDGPRDEPRVDSDAEPGEPLHRDDGAGFFARFFAGSRDLPWVKVALASMAVLVAALGGITAVEAITGKPISSLLGGDRGDGTTVGHVVGDDDRQTEEEQPPQQDTPAPEEPAEPTEDPQEPVPSPSPTPSAEPSDGTGIPSTEDGTTETQPAQP